MSQPEPASKPRPWRRVLLVLSALLPLPGLLASPPDTMLPIYLLFVVAVFARRPIEAAAAGLQRGGVVVVKEGDAGVAHQQANRVARPLSTCLAP